MFSENEKISLRQLKRLLVFDLISVSGIIIPRIATTASGKDGILSIILATLYAFLYVWIILCLSKGFNGNFLGYSTQYAGKVITFIIGILFIAKQFVCCVFAARLFSEVINQALLEETDPRIIILLLLIVSAYAASKGFEVRARIAEVLYFIVIVPIFLFLILGLKNVDLTNLMPLFTEGTHKIFTGGYEVFLTFSILELLLFASPLIKIKRSDVKKGRKIHHSVSQALALVCVLNVLLFIVTLGILGEAETKEKLWSMVTMIQIIKMPGDFIQRQDAIILGIWMLSIFSIVSAFFYYISVITNHIYRIAFKNYVLIPFILLIYGASVVPMETDQFFDYFELYMKYIGMPQSIILPVIILLISKLKKRNINKTAVRTLLLFTFLTTSFTLTGCRDMTEIEDRNFIQGMGIDKNDGNITVYYILPDLKALTKQASDDPEKLTVKLEGKDFFQIEEKYDIQYNKRMDYSHLKTIILGKEFTQDDVYMKELLTYVKNNLELSRNTLVFLSDTNAKDIISLNGDLQGGVGDYLDRLCRINLRKTGKEVITIGDLIFAMNNINPVTGITRIKAHKKTLETIGIGLIAGNKLVLEVDEDDSDYIDIANGHGKNNRIFLNKNMEVNKDVKDIEMSEYVIRINNITRRFDFNWEDEKPLLNIYVEGIGIIEKGVNDSITKKELVKDNLVQKLQEKCNELIENKLNENFENIMVNKKIDFLNLYRKTSYKNRKMWLRYEGKENQFINDLTYTLNVNLKLE